MTEAAVYCIMRSMAVKGIFGSPEMLQRDLLRPRSLADCKQKMHSWIQDFILKATYCQLYVTKTHKIQTNLE